MSICVEIKIPQSRSIFIYRTRSSSASISPYDDYEHPYDFTIDDNGQASNSTWRQVLDLTAHSALNSMSKLKELVLIGHTDSLGTDAYNHQLGLERATFVATELEKRGVPKQIIQNRVGRTNPTRSAPAR